MRLFCSNLDVFYINEWNGDWPSSRMFVLTPAAAAAGGRQMLGKHRLQLRVRLWAAAEHGTCILGVG